jgi:succinate dehydrogenase / fumarate reductase membrane anchor subunit
MGDVLMIKNDSGIKSATGLTGSGSRDWIIQRISAVVLAVYSVVLLGFFLTHGDVTFVEWSSFMTSLPMRLFSLVAVLALAGHALVGMLTVFTDYITTGKLGSSAAGLRLVLQSLMIIAILVFLFWGIMIFWGNGFGIAAV